MKHRPIIGKCWWCKKWKLWFQYYQWGRGGRDVHGNLMCKECTDACHDAAEKRDGGDGNIIGGGTGRPHR